MTFIEMRQKRGDLVEQCRGLLDRAESEKRGLTAEEEQQYGRMWDEQEKLKRDIARAETLQAEEKDLNRSLEDPNRPVPATQETRDGDSPELRAAFGQFLRGGYGALTRETRQAFEQRALQADIDTSGGYIVPPQQFVSQLIQAVDNQVFVRGVATKWQVEKAESLGVPALDTDIGDPTWTSELAIGSEDTGIAFGKRELKPNPLARYIKVSNKLIRQAVFDVEGFVRSRFAYKFGTVMEYNYLRGDGANKPLGVFTASADGISTSRDMATDNTTTAVTADGLMNAKWGLKPQYRARPNTRWMFHTDALKMISKLKDGEGQYLWSAGLSGGVPDRICQLPYFESQYVPNTFTTGLYVGILGDWSFYWIVDALDLTIQRLIELYAATNQTGFIARMESDGMPVLEEAFVRVTLA